MHILPSARDNIYQALPVFSPSHFFASTCRGETGNEAIIIPLSTILSICTYLKELGLGATVFVWPVLSQHPLIGFDVQQ